MTGVSITTLLLVALTGATLLAAVAVRLIFAPSSSETAKRHARIQAMGPAVPRDAAAALVKSSADDAGGITLPLIGNVPLLLRRTGLQDRAAALGVGTFVGAILLAAGLALVLPIWIALPGGMLIAAFATVHILRARHQKRMAALTMQLPDALDLMMRGLRVGHPINATISNVGRTMADPIGAEFRILSKQISHGDYLTDAFRDFAARTGQEDVEYLSVSIAIQHGTGGNLAEMLGTLSKVVRDRIIMRRRIRAISSEGRISAYLLSALPVVIYLATSLTAPDYYADVSDDPMFKPIAILIVALVVGNFLALRKLVSFKV